jgi:polyisoprenoid-binding protein YceI
MPIELPNQRSRARSVRILCFLLVAASLSNSRIWAAGPAEWSGTSEIKFSGTSTLHKWSGSVSAEPFVAKVMMSDASKPTALKAQVVVKVSKMDTKNEERDEKLRVNMKAGDFPLVTGSFDTMFDKVMNSGAATPSHLPFKLTLLGKDQQVNATISNWSLENDVATFDLDFDLSLKACGIEVPSVAYVIRVGDTIKLHANVKLRRA